MSEPAEIEYKYTRAEGKGSKVVCVPRSEPKLHDTGRYLTNPHGFKTPIFSTLKQGSNLPGARKKIK